jgi:hypothetical protein
VFGQNVFGFEGCRDNATQISTLGGFCWGYPHIASILILLPLGGDGFCLSVATRIRRSEVISRDDAQVVLEILGLD